MAERWSAERGFTLIEMAIVMVVIGLLLSGGILALAPVVQNSKTTDTNSRLDRVEQALLVYVIQNGCLPCPADPTHLPRHRASPIAGKRDGGDLYVCTAAACTYAPERDRAGRGSLGQPRPIRSRRRRTASATASTTPSLSGACCNGQRHGTQHAAVRPIPAGIIDRQQLQRSHQHNHFFAAYVLISHGTGSSLAYAAVSAQQAIEYGQAVGAGTSGSQR